MGAGVDKASAGRGREENKPPPYSLGLARDLKSMCACCVRTRAPVCMCVTYVNASVCVRFVSVSRASSLRRFTLVLERGCVFRLSSFRRLSVFADRFFLVESVLQFPFSLDLILLKKRKK